MNNQKWALITGATSGIGKAFAYEFAKRGYNIIGTGTREEILKSVMEDIHTTTGQDTITFIGDLSQEPEQTRLITTALNKRISVLVNNAGFALHARFQESDRKELTRMANLHINSTLRLTHALLPQMLESQDGCIINVASDAAYMAVRSNAVYSGTKAFIRQFSRCLYLDLVGSGVYVQALCPGLTHTDLHEKMGMSRERQTNKGIMRWQEPVDVVKSSLKAMEKNKSICISDPFTKVMIAITSLMPEKLYNKLVARFF